MTNFAQSHVGALDLDQAVEIADRLWWVGAAAPDDKFQCHAYLLEAGDESVLFDPGSLLGWETTRRKIESIVPLSSIRWVVCHHQDPDIVAALPALRALSPREDLQLVTHWRAAALLVHLGLDLEFWNIEEHDWRLEVGGRTLRFVATPYLHFAGAFCTFDEASGTLLSSDLFGGFSSGEALYMNDAEDLDGVEAFHEHYMPSREILLNGLLELERLPLRLIAPQHGRIIPREFIDLTMTRLKAVDCGLFVLQTGDGGYERLQVYKRLMRSTLDALVRAREFPSAARAFQQGLEQILPLEAVTFIAPWEDRTHLAFTQQNRFRGEPSDTIQCARLLGIAREEWEDLFGADCLVLWPGENCQGTLCPTCDLKGLVMPLFSSLGDAVEGLAVIRTREPLTPDPELASLLGRISAPLAGALEREMIRRRLESERDRIFELAIRDPLTGLYTRRYMDEVAGRMISQTSRNDQEQVALLMLDVDHFKNVNDTYGHQTGDEVLKGLAATLRDGVRGADLPARFGGEEFVCFTVVREDAEAVDLAERLRQRVGDLVFQGDGEEFQVTISIGVALHQTAETMDDLMRRADQALYEAKSNGRDRTCLAAPAAPVAG